jgi:hypothetical protein
MTCPSVQEGSETERALGRYTLHSPDGLALSVHPCISAVSMALGLQQAPDSNPPLLVANVRRTLYVPNWGEAGLMGAWGGALRYAQTLFQ